MQTQSQNPLVPFGNPTVITITSREIAEVTGKQHSNVMRDIRNMIKQLEADSELNWHCESEAYIDAQGKSREQYRLDRNTAINLVAGYDPVLRMRIISRLDELERERQQQLSPAEVLIQQGYMLLRVEQEQARLAAEQNDIKAQVKALVDGEDYFTVVGYANAVKMHVDSQLAAKVGRLAARVCQDNKFHIGKASHPIYGQVNTYPREVLAWAFEKTVGGIE